jgi:peptidoglycan/LPS O-acetylase OafA/YrhL
MPVVDSTNDSGTIRKIVAIDGLRAWLAWTVVAAHLVDFTGLDSNSHLWGLVRAAGDSAVRMFMIICGFVIVGMLIERKESWLHYITRRCFRIFPTYLIVLAGAAASMHIARDALTDLSWMNYAGGGSNDFTLALVRSVDASPWTHTFLHALLLQGVMPNNLLANSEFAFLPPAWSLSLEWQFYLIAPALLAVLRHPAWSIFAIASIVGGAVFYNWGIFGEHTLPSVFFGAGPYFLIGIASRLVFADLLRKALPPAALILALGALGLLMGVKEIGLWFAFLVFLARRPGSLNWADRMVDRIGHVAFESKLSNTLGVRSYSTYLVHYPIVQTLYYLLLPLHHFTRVEALGIIVFPAIVLTLFGSDFLYRCVERPMIRVGARLLDSRLSISRIVSRERDTNPLSSSDRQWREKADSVKVDA